MKVADMRKKSEADLLKHADKLRAKIADKNRSLMTGDDTNVREIRSMKKELARTLTVVNEPEVKTANKKETK